MAAAIDDQTTVQIAIQWADRHQQRGRILRQKAEVLAAELDMRNEDLAGMQKQVDELQLQYSATSSTPGSIRPAGSGGARLIAPSGSGLPSRSPGAWCCSR